MALLVRADTIELKNGDRVEGLFKQATADGAIIEVGGQPMTFPLEKVKAIYFGSVSPKQVLPDALEGALEALNGLRSITDAGVTYAQYAPRVLDAKVKIDKYQRVADVSVLRDAIDIAMSYYEMASQAWNARISTSASGLQTMTQIGSVLMNDECPEAKQLVSAVDSSKVKVAPSMRIAMIGSMAGQQPTTLWACAARKLTEARAAVKQ